MPEQPTPPPFNRFARLEEITGRIGAQMTQLLAGVYAEGVKDGVELAAQMCDQSATWIRGLPVVDEGHCAQIAMAEFLRDTIRLAAHQIPDCPSFGLNLESIDAPEDLVAGLSEVYKPEGVLIWLRARNRRLDRYTPLELIARGREDQVRAEIERLVGGAW